MCSGGDFCILCNDHDSITHKIEITIDVPVRWEWLDDNIIADPYILIQDRAFDVTIFSDPNRKIAAWFLHLIIIGAHQDAVPDHRPFADLAANAHNGVSDLRLADAAALRDQDLLQLTIFDGGAGQVTGVGIDRGFQIKEIERWVWARQLQVRFIKGLDRPNIFPVAVEIKAMHHMGMDRFGNDLTPEVIMPQMIGEQICQNLCLEHIDAHRTEQRALRIIAADESILDGRVFWFFHKIRDTTIGLAL